MTCIGNRRDALAGLVAGCGGAKSRRERIVYLLVERYNCKLHCCNSNLFPRIRSVRVLVVDDFRPTADRLAQLLRYKGHCARVTYDASEALAVADSFKPRALISDVHMPGMNGFELAEAFAVRFPECRVLLVTVDPSIVGEFYDHTQIRVVHKPVPFHELFKFLQSCRADE